MNAIECICQEPTRTIQPSIIDAALSIYDPDFRVVDAATSWEGGIKGTVRLMPYSITMPGVIDYVTASQLTQYISQLGYVAICDAASTGQLPLTMDEFITFQRAGNVIFRRLQIRFSRKVFYSDGKANLAISWQRPLHHRRIIVARGYFQFDTDAADGNISIVIACSE